jgi:hypothetical protein
VDFKHALVLGADGRSLGSSVICSIVSFHRNTRSIPLASLLAINAICGNAATLTDNFNSNQDYLANGVAGTVWDGVYFGAGEFANTGTGGSGPGSTVQCDANISTNSMLTVQSSATDWEGTGDDGFFLYKVIPGDFSAVVHVVSPFNTNIYNTAGLQARAFSSGGNPFGGSEDFISWTRFDQFNYANYLRNETNSTVQQINPGGFPNSAYWLRMDRVGNNFTFYQRTNSGDAWQLVNFPPPVNGTTLTRNDFAGQPLQVGIIHATYNTLRGAQFTDFSITAPAFDTTAAPPSPPSNLSVTNTTNTASISWSAAPDGAGSVVVMWAGGNAIKQTPANGFTYNGNATFGLGDMLLATNYFVVCSGTATSVVVTNLPTGAICNVAVFSYAGSGTTTAYNKSPAVANFSTGTATTTNTTLLVDPVSPALTNYTSLGEWNTDGNFESWTATQITNALVTNGILSGSASGSDSQLAKLNFAGGPDLDLGYNDYMELRLQVPADYNGDVLLYYGVTNTPGISSSRVLTIPSAQIPKDGAFHVYRLDLGLEIFWRGTLRDLRIDPLDATGVGKIFALDYLRVGDLAGDVYLPRYSANNPAPGANDSANNLPVIDMESKHFRVLWDAAVATNSFWRANMPHGTLRNLEEVWAFYIKKLGYREPSQSWTPANRNGNKYKVNLTTFYSGYFQGGDAGSFAWLNITPDGLQVDPPTWVPPHEFMHVCQAHQYLSGQQPMDGIWWEGHANYGRERWLYFYRDILGSQSGIDFNYLLSAHMIVAHGRDYYLSWPFFVYLDENPDGLPDLGEGTVAHLWQTNISGVYLYNTLDQQTPVTPLKDIVGYFARRELTFDYKNQVAITNALNTQNPAIWRRFQLTELVRRADDTNWWRVPMEIAPMQGAYATHELIPQGTGAGRVVTVNFHGLPDSARGADWRASFIALNDAGAVRYTPLWNSGSNSITLAANENRLFLVAAGTPNSFIFTGHDDLTYPYRSHPSKQRLHYEVQLFGATPKETTNSTAGLIQHPNGGGWKQSTAVVDSTAYLAPNARVYGTAQVRNNARIEDYAVVTNNAQVLNNAVVSGHALVLDSAIVKENAKVRDWAIISGTSVVAGRGRALEYTQVQGGVVTNDAVAKGCAILWSGGYIGDYGVIDGDFMAARPVTNGFAFGHLPYTGVPDSWVRTAPNHQYADYEFAAANDSMIRDQIGVTDGYLIGSPIWRATDAGRAGVLAFNGTNQYVVLDKSLSDFPELSVAAWIKWGGGTSNQPAWHFGSATNRGMFFTPDDGTGHAKFVIRNGGAPQTLTAPAALLTGVWTHVAVTLSNAAVGRLYINGVLQQQSAIIITPDQLNAGNSNNASVHNYLARGADPAQPFFNGSLDSVLIYTRALTNAEIAAMAPANSAPTLSAISNRTIGAGITLTVTNSATDPDLRWQTLYFSFVNAPSGASVDASSGILTWRPAVAQANTSNLFSVKVADNGSPSLSATQSFSVFVSPLATPVISPPVSSNGYFSLRITGDFGPDYSVQSSTNLFDWATIFTTNSPLVPFDWTDPDPTPKPSQFYRVSLGP